MIYPPFGTDKHGQHIIEACINLQEITSDNKYIEYAKEITQYVLQNFSSEGEDLFYYSGKSQNDVIVRKKEIYDGAIPSGNSVMAFNLFYLSIVLDKPEWRNRSLLLLSNLSELIVTSTDQILKMYFLNFS